MGDLNSAVADDIATSSDRLRVSFNIRVPHDLNAKKRGFEHNDIEDPLVAPKILGKLARGLVKLNEELAVVNEETARDKWRLFLHENSGHQETFDVGHNMAVYELNEDIPSIQTLRKAIIHFDQHLALPQDLADEVQDIAERAELFDTFREGQETRMRQALREFHMGS